MKRVVFLRNVKERPFEAALFFAKILKIVRFVKSILQFFSNTCLIIVHFLVRFAIVGLKKKL